MIIIIITVIIAVQFVIEYSYSSMNSSEQSTMLKGTIYSESIETLSIFRKVFFFPLHKCVQM